MPGIRAPLSKASARPAAPLNRIARGSYMKPEQKIVAVGAASGVVLMLLGVWVLTSLLPQPAITDTVAERLAYALKANMVAVVPLFVMIITIANSRFLSD